MYRIDAKGKACPLPVVLAKKALDAGERDVMVLVDNAVAVFSRNATTGALTFVEAKFDGVGGTDGLAGATGVSLSADGEHVYVADTHQARLWRYDRKVGEQRPEWIATAPGPVGFDSLAVTAAGNICVATIYEGGITTIIPDGTLRKYDIPGERYVTNIAFGGEDMRDAWITLSTSGRLVRLRWDEPGLELHYNG